MAPRTLESLVSPTHAALLLVELQNGVVGEQSALPELADAARRVGVVGHSALLADAARSAGVPVIHCTAEDVAGGFGGNENARLFIGARRAGAINESGSDVVKPLAELGPAPGDIVLPRYHGLSPMTGGSLDSLLRNTGITAVVVAGVSLNIAVTNLVFDAVNRSYQVVVVTDAVAGLPVEFGHQVVEHSLQMLSTLATTEQVVTAWAAVPAGRSPSEGGRP